MVTRTDKQMVSIAMPGMVRLIANAIMPFRFLSVLLWFFHRRSPCGRFLRRVLKLSASGIHLNTGVPLV